MTYLQMRVNYNFHNSSAVLYRELLAPLYQSWAQRYFFRWSIRKSWKNGRHILISLDSQDHFFSEEMLRELETRVVVFLLHNPSPPYDTDKQLMLQARLNEMESAGLDVSWVAENNTHSMRRISVDDLAAGYEHHAQWQAVFDTDVKLLPLAIQEWIARDEHERFVCELLILLACVYPPLPSTNPEINECNGFMSYYSHFHLWRHRLPPAQQATVDERFHASYAVDRQRYRGWLAELESGFTSSQSNFWKLAPMLIEAFLGFTRMASLGVIHSRSPYPKDRLAPADTMTDLHRKIFYKPDGSANQFTDTFAGYRWLLNIVYRFLPLLDVSPLKRHYFNFALDQLQRENLPVIGHVRSRMLGLPLLGYGD